MAWIGLAQERLHRGADQHPSHRTRAQLTRSTSRARSTSSSAASWSTATRPRSWASRCRRNCGRPAAPCRAARISTRRSRNNRAEPLGANSRDDLYCRDKALYIYTSGTTGLPKAANISHMRLLHIMMSFQGAVNGKPDDRMYDVLPLYHSSGGIAALGPPLLGRRFGRAAQQVLGHRVLGRLPPLQADRVPIYRRALPLSSEHARKSATSASTVLRVAIGNGLRPEIWARFQERFRSRASWSSTARPKAMSA